VWICNLVDVDITDALAEARAARARLEGQRQAIRDQLMKIELDLKAAQQEEAVLRDLAKRYNLEVPEDAQPLSEEVRQWRALTRSDAVERVLAEASKPLSPTDITEALADKGREDSAAAVSATLAYLKTSKRAAQQGRGQWMQPGRSHAVAAILAGAFVAAAHAQGH
jgi:hypothetical protein